jgi:2-polyprenyl-6-methoxyphenol hydroxylase-like FAD-dependent oxidoreductase
MRLDGIERRVGAPSLGIHRADLLRLLAGAVDRGSIHVQAHCVGFRAEPGHVIARFADGHEQQTDLLVGADGLYSVIREQLLGKAPRAIAATPVGGGSPSSRMRRSLRAFQARHGGAVGASACCR